MVDSNAMYIKTGDTDPAFQAQLVDVIDGTDVPVSLVAASAARLLIKSTLGTLLVDRVLTIDTPASAGYVSGNWVAGDTDTPGTHNVEVEVTWNTGRRRTFPPDGYGRLIVTNDLG